MERFVVDHAKAFATWGEGALVALLVLCVLAFAWLARGGRRGVTADPRRRLIQGVFLALGLLSIGVLYILRGPFRPFMETTRRLQSGVGRAVPEVVFRRLPDGVPARLAELRGRVVLLNLWATWCGPCIRELPTLHALEERLSPSGLTVVAISDEPFERVLRFSERYPLPAVAGSAEGFPWLPLGGFRPYTLVIDRNGILRGSVFGTREVQDFERMVRPYL